MSVSVYMYVHVYMCVCVCLYLCVCICVYVPVYLCMCICVCACVYLCTCICVCVPVRTCACMHVCVHVPEGLVLSLPRQQTSIWTTRGHSCCPAQVSPARGPLPQRGTGFCRSNPEAAGKGEQNLAGKQKRPSNLPERTRGRGRG